MLALKIDSVQILTKRKALVQTKLSVFRCKYCLRPCLYFDSFVSGSRSVFIGNTKMVVLGALITNLHDLSSFSSCSL